jgi:hypothetical protein
MKALAINCTLRRAPAESSCELLLVELLEQMRGHDVEGEVVRAVDLNIKPGVTSDEGEGEGDDWPALRIAFSMPTSSSWARQSGSDTPRASASES